MIKVLFDISQRHNLNNITFVIVMLNGEDPNPPWVVLPKFSVRKLFFLSPRSWGETEVRAHKQQERTGGASLTCTLRHPFSIPHSTPFAVLTESFIHTPSWKANGTSYWKKQRMWKWFTFPLTSFRCFFFWGNTWETWLMLPWSVLCVYSLMPSPYPSVSYLPLGHSSDWCVIHIEMAAAAAKVQPFTQSMSCSSIVIVNSSAVFLYLFVFLFFLPPAFGLTLV